MEESRRTDPETRPTRVEGDRTDAPREDRVRDEREPARTESRRREGAVVDRGLQHERFGGLNVGAAFFGWLVAIGVAALLAALLSAAGTAIGLTEVSESEAEAAAETISLIGGILLIVVLAIAYFAGGYVAGRMSRFDGGRQGLGTWVLGLLVTLLLAAAGAIAGSEYNLLGELELPRIPVDEGTLATGAAITLLLVLVLTALAAILGGKAGERYHRRVDRAGVVDERHV
jgi:hypothetical protein